MSNPFRVNLDMPVVLQGELAQRLWNRAMDRLLENMTGHKFDPRPVGTAPGAGMCKRCGASCLDAMDKAHNGDLSRCPKALKDGR